MQKIPPLKNKSSANLSDEIIQKAENSASFQRTLDIRRKLLKTLIIFSIFFIPIVCVPLNFLISEKTVSSSKKNLENNPLKNFLKKAFMTIAFGGPITFIIFAGLLYLKNRSGRYVNFITPVAVVLCWIFLFIPFCVLIPCFSAFLQNHTQDFASFLRLTIACSALLIMLGVTIFSIIMNVILKRFEFEKKLRFIVLKLKQALFNVAVRSDVLTCRRLYETFFLLDDEEGYRVQLIDGNPVNWLPVPREDPDLHYSKQLVTMEAFRVLKRKKAPIEKDVKAMGCFERCLRSLCCIKERKEDKVNLDLLQNALGNFQFDEELLLADDFLSHKFKHRNVELINEDDERQNLNLYKFLHDKQEQKEKFYFKFLLNIKKRRES